MKENIFQECLIRWKESDGFTPFWKELAKKFGYDDSEKLRYEFKYERKRRGIKKDPITKGLETNCKILLYDIETTPILALVWGIWNYDVNTEAILQDWHIASWSAKWLFSDEIMSDVLTVEEAENHNDRRIVESLWKIINEADVIVAHNGDRFDSKKLNTRFLAHGMLPMSHHQSVDTLKIAKEAFNFTSNRLDYINEYLGIPKKEKTEFELWKRVFHADPKALKEMEMYNRNDVDILEDLFLRLRPYAKGLPNMNLWNEENVSVCPSCGSKELDWNTKPYYTYTGRYKAFRCNSCGALGRSRTQDLSPEKRKAIVR